MRELDAAFLVGMIEAISQAITAAREELNALDSALGDGDHGTSLSAAYADAAEKVAILVSPSPAAVLETTARSLMNRMGGASGALYGTLFLRASMTAKEKTVLSLDDMKLSWQAALNGVKDRGKAQPGDKTMIDALQPAVEAFTASGTMDEGFEAAANAATAGAQNTSSMIAKYGRAKFTGERSIGHIDAGARSIAVMYSAMNRYWKEQRDGET
jgi:dihydroxyacetone kinase-like protein